MPRAEVTPGDSVTTVAADGAVTTADAWQSIDFDLPDGAAGSATLRLRLRGDADAAAIAAAVIARDQPARRSVVLVSIDTLRADHLSAYGHHRDTTAVIDRLAASGARFDNAISTSSWTLPAHASLLTSRPPGDLMSFPRSAVPFETPAPLLARILREHGYETVAFTGGGFLSSSYGFQRGFDRYAENGSAIDDTAVNLARVEAGGSARRALLPLLPHLPGPRSVPRRRLPRHPGSRRDRARAIDRALRRRPPRRRRRPRPPARAARATTPARGRDRGRHRRPRRGVRRALAGDPGIGPRRLAEEILHIPMVIAGAGIPAGRRPTALVSLLDVAPTILRFAGVAIPSSYQGRGCNRRSTAATSPSGRS